MRCLGTVLVCVLAVAFASSAGARRSERLRRFSTGGWVVLVNDDRFTGQRTCILRSKSTQMLYQPGAIGFRVRQRDTLDAVYRIDDGQPVRWQDRYPALIAAGVEVEGPGLDDPTGRIVWVPEAEVRGARTLTVRTRDKGWGKRYRLGGVDAMIAATHRLGCIMPVDFARTGR